MAGEEDLDGVGRQRRHGRAPGFLAAEPSFKTPVSYEEADRRAETLLAKLTVEEKLQMITGSNSFFIKSLPRQLYKKK